MASRRGRAFYEQLLKEVERGQPVSDVAKRHDVRAKTLSWWCWKLRQSKPKGTRKKTKRVEKGAALVPVVVRGQGCQSGQLVKVSLGGVQIAFESGIDPDYVAALARALRGGC